MDDVRYLAHARRRRQQASCIVDGLVARQGARRLADQMLRTSTRIQAMADDALDATIGLMWLGAHLDFPDLPELGEGPCVAPA